MFGKFKEAMGNISQAREMQQKAKELDKKLRASYFEVSSSNVTIKANAKKEIDNIDIKDGAELTKLGKEIKDLVNKAMKKADEIAMQEMRSLIVY